MFLTSHDIKIIKYKAASGLKSEAAKTKLSVLWWFLDPILSMGIYYVVFGLILARYGMEFIPELLLGLVTYQWFMHCFSKSINSINGSSRLVTQIQFNKSILPLVKISMETFKSSIVFSSLLIFLWLLGFSPSFAYVYLPAVIVTQGLLIAATSLLVATYIPFLPDIKNVIAHGTRVLMYLSGVLYPLSAVPSDYQELFLLNPLAFLVESYRQIIIRGETPDTLHLLSLSLATTILLVISLLLIQKYNHQFARILLQR